MPRTSSMMRVGAQPKILVRTARMSEHTFDIRFGEIVADIEQAASAFFGQLVGKAVAEIEGGWVHASSPLLVGMADPPRRGLGDRNDIEIEPSQELGRLDRDSASDGDDQQFGQCPG